VTLSNLFELLIFLLNEAQEPHSSAPWITRACNRNKSESFHSNIWHEGQSFLSFHFYYIFMDFLINSWGAWWLFRQVLKPPGKVSQVTKF